MGSYGKIKILDDLEQFLFDVIVEKEYPDYEALEWYENTNLIKVWDVDQLILIRLYIPNPIIINKLGEYSYIFEFVAKELSKCRTAASVYTLLVEEEGFEYETESLRIGHRRIFHKDGIVIKDETKKWKRIKDTRDIYVFGIHISQFFYDYIENF